MKICAKCLEECFDEDLKCINCGSEDLVDQKDFNSIKDKLINTNVFERKVLCKNERYNAIHCYLCKRYGDGYWRKTKSYSVVSDHDTSSTIKDDRIVVVCPYCKSTDVKKITVTSKAIHTAVFGIFSLGRNSKQWHCNNCVSDF